MTTPTGNNPEVIAFQLVVTAEKALTDAQSFRAEVERIKQVMLQAREVGGQSFNDIAEGIRRANDEAKKLARQQNNADFKGINSRSITTALNELNTETKQNTESMLSLGKVSQFVFGTVLGVGAVQALRSVITYLQEATAAAVEFEHSQYLLEVGVRGLQRSGIDTSLKEWKDIIQEIKSEFPIFSEVDITDAVSQVTLMTREFGFTDEQMKQLVRTSIVLAEVTGRDLNDTIRAVTVSIASGYTESLQKMQLNISRGTLQQKALEMGYKGAWQSLDSNIRAQITYQSVLEGTAALQADAGKITETATGKQLELSSAWKDFTKFLGSVFLPIWKVVLDTLIYVVKVETTMGEFGKKFVTILGSQFYAAIFSVGAAAVMMWQNITGQGKYGYDDFVKVTQDLSKTAADFFMDLFGFSDKPILGDTEVIDNKAFEEYKKLFNLIKDVDKEIDKEVEENRKKLLDIDNDYTQDVFDLYDDWMRDLDDLRREYEQDQQDAKDKYYQDQQDAERDHQQELEDIQRKYNQRMEDEDIRYQQALADENEKFDEQIADENEEYYQQQLEDEAKFQEKLRQLREDFIFDLEEAVEQRDARAILRLIRQYNKDRAQMIRENELRKQQQATDHAQELADIEEQREKRIQELALEHQRRQEEIERQRQREQEEEAIEYARRLEDMRLDFERRLEELRIEYEREKEDLRRHLQEQLDDRRKAWATERRELENALTNRKKEILAAFLEENDITASQVSMIADIFEKFYGPGGVIPGFYDFSMSKIAEMMQMQQDLADQTNNLFGDGGDYSDAGTNKGNTGGTGTGMAEGGSMILNKPTRILAGEKGPELATFTPLGRQGANVGRLVNSQISLGGEQSSRVAIEVFLSPDLEGRIVDQSLSQTAEIFLRTVR